MRTGLRGIELIVVLMVLTTTSIAPAADESTNADPRCGLYALYVGLSALDVDVEPLPEFTEHLGDPPPEGYSLGQLAEAAEGYSMRTLAVKTSAENLQRRQGRFACIAHIRGNHFVNIGQIVDGLASIIDPPREYTLPVDTLNSQWDGTALLISPDPLIAEENLPRPIPWPWILIIGLVLFLASALWIVGKSMFGTRATGARAP